MTTDELDGLPNGTVLYLPTEWEVVQVIFAGRVHNRNFYTLLHPPDTDGVVSNKRPVYLDAVQMMTTTLDEQSAWLAVIEGLEERKRWIYKLKLTDQ